VTDNASHAGTGRVAERRRAVALARHYREFEGLTIQQIADRLGRAPATVKAYFYDPTGEKARAVKARYVGVCRGCGAYTQPRKGKGDAYAYCKACHPGAIKRRWTAERVLDAMCDWRAVTAGCRRRMTGRGRPRVGARPRPSAHGRASPFVPRAHANTRVFPPQPGNEEVNDLSRPEATTLTDEPYLLHHQIRHHQIRLDSGPGASH